MLNTSKPALITGGCGFVGRHMTRRLLKEGYTLWIVDDCSIGLHPDDWLPDAKSRRSVADGVIEYGDGKVIFLHGDARDFFAGRIALGKLTEPEFGDVFHFAAVIGGRATIDGNPMAVAIDLALDALCFNWAVRKMPDRVLCASSSAAYPVDLQGKDGAVALKESEYPVWRPPGPAGHDLRLVQADRRVPGTDRASALRPAHRLRAAVLRLW